VVLDLMIHDLDIVLTFAKSEVREVRAVGLPILSPKVDIANVRVEFESGCVANFTASRVSTERIRKLRFFEPRQYVSIDYARRDVVVIRIESGASGVSEAGGVKDGASDSQSQLAEAAAEFLATGKLDAAVIQKLMASGQVPVGLAMKFAAAKNDPEKLKDIATGLAGSQAGAPAGLQEAPAPGLTPGLTFLKPEVKEGEPLKLEVLSFLDAVRARREPKMTARQGRAALELALKIQATMAEHAERAGLGDFFKGSE
jgi:predicted dehydrogenase